MKYNYNKVQFTRRNNLLKDYGYTSYQEFLNSEFWIGMKKNLKSKIRFKKCNCCGSEENLELHHFKYQNFLDGSNSHNIISVCRECHEQIHKLSRELNISFKIAARRLRRTNKYNPNTIIGFNQNTRETRYEIITKNSLPCPKCGISMERRKHREIPDTKYYFLQWDFCKPCMHVQHYEEFKRQNLDLKSIQLSD